MAIGTGHPTASCVAAATQLAVVGSNRRTNSFVMCVSSAQEPGGTKSTAMRCWRFAAPSITERSTGCSSGIDSGYERHKNYRMLLYLSSLGPLNYVLIAKERFEP